MDAARLFRRHHRSRRHPGDAPLTDDETTIEQLVSQCDGFLVTGGHDVDPERYGEAAGPKTVKLCKARDRMEECLIPSVIAADKPLLGICRGIQSLNVALGGTLWQDLPGRTSQPGRASWRQAAV